MRYEEDMTVEVSDFDTHTEGTQRFGAFNVRVLESPAGEMKPEEAVPVEYDDKRLQSILRELEERELNAEGLVDLGRSLAQSLLPTISKEGAPNVRELLARSLLKIGPEVGLRLRLRLPSELAVMPWEYLYVERAGQGMDGFLALDPRVAIVRHEAHAAPPPDPLKKGDLRVVTAFASAQGLPELDLEEESKIMTDALGGVEGIELLPCENATLGTLQPLLPGAGIFHFAGHGDFSP